MIKTNSLKYILMVSTLLAGPAAHAQVSSNGEGADASRFDEVVVTAQKREQNANDIGISISVIGGNQLDDFGVVDTTDLAAYIPGLTYSDSGLAVPVYTLRGVGFTEQSVQATSTVGLYNDQIPIPFPIMSNGLTMDIERVEVLKGPQGTVFGRNSTGGTINNVVNKPTDVFEASATLDYGRFETLDLGGVVNIPINETMALRVAARRVESGEGWQESVSRDETNGRDDKFAVRALLSIEPSEKLDALLSYSYWSDNSETQTPQFLARATQNTATAGPTDSTAVQFFLYDAGFAAIPQFGLENSQATDWVGGNARTPDPENDMSNHALSATINYDLNNNITLTSLTSFNSFENKGAYDNSGWGGIPLRGVTFTRADGAVFEPQDLIDARVRADYDQFDTIGGTAFLNDSKIEAFSQELRLSGDTGLVNWLVGASYSKDTVDSDTTQLIDFATQGNGYGFGLQTVLNNTTQEGENWGIFAHTEWALSEALNLTVGLRYDEDEKSYAGCSRDNGDGETAFLLSLLSVGGLAFSNPPFGPGDCVMSLGSVPFTDNGGVFEDTLSEDSLSWKLGLDYDLSDDMLVYASYSRGFKAGSFPTLTANQVAQLFPVVQERIDAFELGLKSSALGGNLQFNGAAFYYKYKDKQLFTKVNSAIAGPINSLTNIPDSEVYGVEFDVTWRPTDAFLFGLASTYVETEVKEFGGSNQLGIDADFTGSQFPLAPKFQASAFAGYEFQVSDSLGGYFNVNAQYSDESLADYEINEVRDNFGNPTAAYNRLLAANGLNIGDTNVGVAPVFVLPSTFFAGARIGIRSNDDGWDASLWVRNLTDEYSLNNVRKSSDQVIGYTARPRTYGVTLSYDF